MKLKSTTFLLSIIMFSNTFVYAQRHEQLLEKNWKFIQKDVPEAYLVNFDDSRWQTVTIPHDWAIYGPFDRNHDLQTVTIIENNERVPSVKTGRTGGLPYVGVGWYRTKFTADKDKQVALQFDGAMSEARVYVNGKEAIFWPYGYNSFHVDVTELLNESGVNTLAVRLENQPQSSRWYPGAGLYRNVRLIITEKVHVPIWGTYITTPHISEQFASVRLRTKVENAGNNDIRIETEIISPEGKSVTERKDTRRINHGEPIEQNFIVYTPKLWSPETPYLYKAVSKIYVGDQLMDEYTTRFGIRHVEIIADKGFYLNGKHRQF